MAVKIQGMLSKTTSGQGRMIVRKKPDIVRDGLVMHLDAAGYAGSGAWIDPLSGISFSLYNGVTHQAGNGGLFRFDGSYDGWASSTATLGDLPTWTIDAWVKMNANPYNGASLSGLIFPCVFTETFDTNPTPINLTMLVPGNNNGNDFTFGGGWWDGYNWYWINAQSPNYTAGPSITVGTWQHIVLTYDGTDVKIYSNGSLFSTRTSVPGSPMSSDLGYRICRRWDQSSNAATADVVPADITTVRIYNRHLTASEVSQNWGVTRGRHGI